MPTLTATPLAMPQGKEFELDDQEFELDIRISMPTPVMPQDSVATAAGDYTCQSCASCATCAQVSCPSCAGSCASYCGICQSAYCTNYC